MYMWDGLKRLPSHTRIEVVFQSGLLFATRIHRRELLCTRSSGMPDRSLDLKVQVPSAVLS